MSMWAQAYSKKGTNVAYQAIGSGGGVSQINAQTVDFGASDTPMLDTELAASKGGPILHIPLVLGAVTVAYNVKGVGKGLNFDGQTIGKIYRRADHELERPGDQEAQPEGEPARRADRGRPSLRRLGYDGRVHRLPDEDEPGAGSRSWAAPTSRSARPLPGPSASAARATMASPPWSARPRARSDIPSCSTRSPSNLSYGNVKNKKGTFITPCVATTSAAALKTSFPPDMRTSLTWRGAALAYPITGTVVRARGSEPDGCRPRRRRSSTSSPGR